MGRNIEAIHPLSPVQEGMLFHSLASEERGVYVGQLSCTLEGPLDQDAFRGAWQRLVARHAVLRTAFVWRDVERPVQVVARHAEPPLSFEDWRDLDDDEAARRFEALLADDVRQGFDLARAPLLRLWLIRTGERVHRFAWTQHHAVLDGWSLSLVLGELFAIYHALRARCEPELPARRPYRDYLRWLRQSRDSEPYWRRVLGGVRSPTPLPFDRRFSRPMAPRCEMRRPLPARLDDALGDLARRRHLTLNTLVQAAWTLVLARFSGRREVVFGAVVSGRPPELDGIESMVGLFINTLPMRVAAPPAARIADWLDDLRQRQVELQAHEASSLVDVRRWSGADPDGGSPDRELFESTVVFENYPVDRAVREERGHLAIRDVRSRESAHYPLVLLAGPDPVLELRLTWDSGRFEATSARRIVAAVERVLAAVARDPVDRLGEIDLLSPAERTQVLVEWNNTGAVYEGAATLDGLIEAQARRTPDAVALVTDGPAEHSLSFAELDRRAAVVAEQLRTFGVGPESVVAVALERSAELIIGLVAVLKAGAAYLPLDLSYPEARLAFMLADSDAVALLVAESVPEGLEVPDGIRIQGLNPRQRLKPAERRSLRDRKAGSGGWPQASAYVIYTSGSTGRPKGATNTHAAIRNRLLWMQAEFYGCDGRRSGGSEDAHHLRRVGLGALLAPDHRCTA